VLNGEGLKVAQQCHDETINEVVWHGSRLDSRNDVVGVECAFGRLLQAEEPEEGPVTLTAEDDIV